MGHTPACIMSAGIPQQLGFDDTVPIKAEELDVAHRNNVSRWWNTQPGGLEDARVIATTADPVLTAIECAGNYVVASFEIRNRIQQRRVSSLEKPL